MAYHFLCRFFPPGVATALTGLWFAILMLLIAVFAFEPQAEFRYIGM